MIDDRAFNIFNGMVFKTSSIVELLTIAGTDITMPKEKPFGFLHLYQQEIDNAMCEYLLGKYPSIEFFFDWAGNNANFATVSPTDLHNFLICDDHYLIYKYWIYNPRMKLYARRNLNSNESSKFCPLLPQWAMTYNGNILENGTLYLDDIRELNTYIDLLTLEGILQFNEVGLEISKNDFEYMIHY